MAKLDPETRAQLREFIGALLALLLGFFGTFLGLGWLLLLKLPPASPWWEILSEVAQLFLFSCFAGLGLGVGVLCLVSRLHYWLGIYRCPFCNQPHKSVGYLCPCRRQELGDPPALQVRRSTIWRWQNIRWVLFGYVVLIPIAMAGTRLRPGLETEPIWIPIAQAHFVLCIMIVALVELLTSVLRWLHRGEGIVRRWEVFVFPFVLISCGVGLILSTMGVL